MIARYERGEIVVMSRHSTGPYGYGNDFIFAPLVAGVLCGGIVLALGMALILRDRTYLRGLGNAARDLR